MLRIGYLIEKKYRITKALSAGGMGAVYEAEEIELARKVAIKVIHDFLVNDAENLARFEREAEILSRLDCKNIAKVFRYGWLEDSVESGSPYIVMEFITGTSLREHLQRLGRLPVEDAVDFVSQICEAVTHAHAKGVIHRDLKPDNVMLTADASGALVAKLIDFGLGKIIADNVQASTAWTKTGLLLGSAHYMSPELCGGGPAVPASDIYAVGCILFELIEGRPPFDADSALGVVYLQANEPPPSLSLEMDRNATSALTRIIHKALAKKTSDRYSTVQELGADLHRFSTMDYDKITPLSTAIAGGTTRKYSPRTWVFPVLILFAVVICSYNGLLHGKQSSISWQTSQTESKLVDLAEQAKERFSKCPQESKSTTAEIVLGRLGTLQTYYWNHLQKEKYNAVNKEKLYFASFTDSPYTQKLRILHEFAAMYTAIEPTEKDLARKAEYRRNAIQAFEQARGLIDKAELSAQIQILAHIFVEDYKFGLYQRAETDLKALRDKLDSNKGLRPKVPKIDEALGKLYRSMQNIEIHEPDDWQSSFFRAKIFGELSMLTDCSTEESLLMKARASQTLSTLRKLPLSGQQTDSLRKLEQSLAKFKIPERSLTAKQLRDLRGDKVRNVITREVFIHDASE